MADDASAQARRAERVPRGDQRATHEDRDRAVGVLRLAAGDGRLAMEELDERVAAALTACTYGELTALVADLSAARDIPAGPPWRRGRKTWSGSSATTVVRGVSASGWCRGASSFGSAPAASRWTSPRQSSRRGTVKVLAPWDPDVPARFRIDVTGTIDVYNITARPPGRTLRPRLLRQPQEPRQALPPSRP